MPHLHKGSLHFSSHAAAAGGQVYVYSVVCAQGDIWRESADSSFARLERVEPSENRKNSQSFLLLFCYDARELFLLFPKQTKWRCGLNERNVETIKLQNLIKCPIKKFTFSIFALHRSAEQ